MLGSPGIKSNSQLSTFIVWILSVHYKTVVNSISSQKAHHTTLQEKAGWFGMFLNSYVSVLQPKSYRCGMILAELMLEYIESGNIFKYRNHDL